MGSVSDDEKPRSASEVIIALEQKTDLLFKMVASTDVNIKLFLDRLNKICSLLESIDSKIIGSKNTESLPDKEDDFTIYKEEVVSEFPVEIEKSPKGTRRNARPETYSEEKPSTKIIPVVQSVLDPNGKSVFMAEVEIINEDTSESTKTRTTAAGKWQLSLPIGNYKVLIVKRATGNRKKLEYKGTFVVLSTDKPVQLDPVSLSINQ